MADDELVATIGRLVAEEHEVRAAAVGAGEADTGRLVEIEQTLDQCWDLLRQRRAAREAGTADTSDVRPKRIVEGYQQ
jgi:hypothetical protein